MGTTVIGGMLAATALAIFIIPALYVIVERVASIGKQRAPHPQMFPNRVQWRATNVKKAITLLR